MKPLLLDICCGLKGASAAFVEYGWDVVTLDIDPDFAPTVCADVRGWSWGGRRPDVIWCSPPCNEFSREWMPWCRTGVAPDLSIVDACRRIIAECHPRYWVIENVRGAVPYLGAPRQIIGPFHLWGFFPDISLTLTMRKKESMSSTASAERAKIPYALSRAICLAVEQTAILL